MTHTPPQSGANRTTGIVLLLVVLLCGCSSSPRQPDSQQPPDSNGQAQSATSGQIDLSLPASALDGQFQQADAALDRGDWLAASIALPTSKEQLLTPFEQQYQQYLQARLDYIKGNTKQATNSINALLADDIPVALRYRVLAFRAHSASLAAQHTRAALDLHNILQLGELENAQAWQRALWRALQQASEQDLQAASALASDAEWDGWLQLALASRETGYVRDAELRRWRDNHPQHRAATRLPGGLEELLANPVPAQQVALLLPLSGRYAPAGRAVLDGYLAAHFAANNPTAQIQVLDSQDYPNAASAYQQAVANGAGIVIGPLNKLAVAELATLPSRPIPILALNRTDTRLPATGSAMVQFSLAPEDEAANLAELAFGDGGRRAIILSPRDSWGDSAKTALARRWQELGGHVAGAASFAEREDYSPGIRRALGLGDSQRRAALLADILVDEIEFTPRRRQDVDTVFLLSRNAAQARALKPLLAFHYASDLPVYTISSAYSGVPHPENRDLNGIHLLETPWLLGANAPLRVALAAGDTGSDNYPRLNALGADAFMLQSEFARLAAGPDALLRGNTGLLSMDAKLQIERSLRPATFDGGVISAR